jgi:RNA-directed DNA polymerase
LETNLIQLHEKLITGIWYPSSYYSFFVRDPKLRHIHKACVSDRVVHQAVFRVLYPIFDKGFIFDSYSCRLGKGTHRAVKRLSVFLRRASHNYRQSVFVLKCDIKKFFEAVDHQVLMELVRRRIEDGKILALVWLIVESFTTQPGKGLPLGNVTSQLFSNIYLNELDQFMKHSLRIRHYIRYCDDFVVIADNREYLAELVLKIGEFLKQTLKLELHQKKIEIRKYSQGVDFLGYVTLPHYRVLRTKTKRRVFKKLFAKQGQITKGILEQDKFNQSIWSYLGVLKHCYSYKLSIKLQSIFRIK